ncbi:MAG TPA: HD domain-containing protein [Allosphingosinicella sp.]|nr:HD domain-containing protein [Allosphingosinicella sp.]
MTGLVLSATCLAVLVPAAPAPAQLPTQRNVTVGGITLSSPWRAAVYAHAREKLLHPAWGWRHSERDFLLARQIAREEGLAIDEDILFAAAFLHDSGAIPPFAKEGVDHAVRSAELAEPLLRKVGFPMAKFPAVKAAITGHMYDQKAGASDEAVVLHDADALDFLGATGIARRLAVTGDARDMDSVFERLQLVYRDIPGRLVTSAAKRMAIPRLVAMQAFFEQLKRETPPLAPL